MLIVGYVRESTDTPEQRRALEQQRSRLSQAGVSEENLFLDVQSGGDDDRREFVRLLALLRERFSQKLRTRLVITRPDRITRKGAKNLEILELFERGMSGGCLELFVIDMGGVQDFSNPYVWSQFAEAGIKSEFERRMLRMRVKAGMEFHRAQGRAPASLPFGFRRTVAGGMELDPELREEARFRVEAFLSERGLRNACRRIQERYGVSLSPSGYRRWLLNPALQGHTQYFRPENRSHRRSLSPPITHYGTHEALISQIEGQLIAEILGENKALRGRNTGSRRYPLQGQIWCVCGHKMTLVPTKNRQGVTYNYLRCLNNREKFGDSRCSQPLARLDQIIEQTISQCVDYSGSLISATVADLATVDLTDSPEILKLQEKLSKLLEVQAISDDAAIQSLIAQTQADILGLRQLASGRREVSEEDRELLMAMIDLEIWKALSDEDLRGAFKRFVDRVIVEGRTVAEVRFRV